MEYPYPYVTCQKDNKVKLYIDTDSDTVATVVNNNVPLRQSKK